MPAGIEIYNYVTNQKGSPAIWSDLLAARPPAGFIGRLFVSTDTFEIYRDNGLTWDLISGGGGPGVNIYNSDGSLTGARVVTMAGNNLTFEGGASTARLAMSANNNVPRIFSFRTAGVPRWAFRIDGNETGSNIGGDFALRAYNDAGTFTFSPFSVERRTGEKSLIANETLTTAAANLTGLYNLTTATMGAGVSLTGGNPQAASHNNYTVINDGSYTVADSIFFGAQSNVLRLTSGGSGTATFTQTGNVRSAAANLNQVQYDTSNGSAITYTHVAVGQNLGIYRLSGAGSLAITNAYGHLINDLDEYGNANLTITNRWGIYQNSVTDVNYLRGTTLVGTTINAGFKLDVQGTFRTSADALINNHTFGKGQNSIASNIAIGTSTLSSATITSANTIGIGVNTMSNFITGIDNVGLGNFVMTNLTSGNSNTIVGRSAGTAITTSSNNTAMGRAALAAATSSSNAAFGHNSLTNITSGGNNTALGALSGYLVFGGGINQTSNNSVYIGYDTRASASGNTNEVVIGYNAIGNGSNSTTLGNSSTTKTILFGSVGLGTTTPSVILDIVGSVKIDSSMNLVPTTTVPTATAGTLYYDSATNKLKLHDGTSFVDLN